MSREKTPCCKSLMDGYHLVRCRKPATVEREGRHYCTIHDPVRVAEKDEARSAKWEAKMVEQRKAWALHAAAPELLEALKRSPHDASCHPSEGRHSERCMEVKALIAKAEGRE